MWRLLFVGMLAVALPAPCQAQSTIRLARIAEVPGQFVSGEILRAVYGRLNIALEFVDVAGARALALSSSGRSTARCTELPISAATIRR
jgi:polar amino acid transport system substrate-binding protein